MTRRTLLTALSGLLLGRWLPKREVTENVVYHPVGISREDFGVRYVQWHDAPIGTRYIRRAEVTVSSNEDPSMIAALVRARLT